MLCVVFVTVLLELRWRNCAVWGQFPFDSVAQLYALVYTRCRRPEVISADVLFIINQYMNMKKIQLVLLLTCGVFVLAGCGKQVTQQSNANAQTNVNEEVSNTNQVSAVNTSVVVEDDAIPDEEIDTSDWLTYENEEYGFSFMYPGDWSISDTTVEPLESRTYAESLNYYQKRIVISVDNITKYKDIPFDQYIGMGDGYGKTQDTFREEQEQSLTQDSIDHTSQPVVSLSDGIRAVVWFDGDEGIKLHKKLTIYNENYRIILRTRFDDLLGEARSNEVVLNHSLLDTASLSIEERNDTFMQIGTTFSLSENSSTDSDTITEVVDTSDWRIYEINDFFIKYPPVWQYTDSKQQATETNASTTEFKINGAMVGTINCPIINTGYEAWEFDMEEYNDGHLRKRLWFSKVTSDNSNSSLAILLMNRKSEEAEGASCQFTFRDYVINKKNIREIYNSLSLTRNSVARRKKE